MFDRKLTLPAAAHRVAQPKPKQAMLAPSLQRAPQHSAPTRSATVEWGAQPVQAKPAMDFRYGDLIEAARAPRGASTGAPRLPIQAKLEVSQPGDPLEQEADRVADRVMQRLAPLPIRSASMGAVQRACAACDEEERTHPHAQQGVAGLKGEEDDPRFAQGIVLRKAEYAAPRRAAGAASTVMNRLVQRRSAGEPLPAATRARMEEGIGHGFPEVRVHRDAEAGELSRQLGAQAFTYGSDIYFAPNAYDPERASGSRLLAHELVHVVQQGHAGPPRTGGAASSVKGTSGPMIHRVATWAAGTVHQVRNLAAVVLGGGGAGVTLETLNGTTLNSAADARRAIVGPTLTFTPVPAPPAPPGRDAGAPPAPRVRASIAAVPQNTGSFDETVLSAGPWATGSTKAAVGGITGLPACTGAGASRFTAHGLPSDAEMAASNRRHEDHHVADHRRNFLNIIGVWDTKMTAAQAAGTTYEAGDNAAAEAALHAAMGGTPREIAANWFNADSTSGDAYHGTAAGGPISWDNARSNPDCSTAEVDATNPA
jgi:hypothetical protein